MVPVVIICSGFRWIGFCSSLLGLDYGWSRSCSALHRSFLRRKFPQTLGKLLSDSLTTIPTIRRRIGLRRRQTKLEEIEARGTLPKSAPVRFGWNYSWRHSCWAPIGSNRLRNTGSSELSTRVCIISACRQVNLSN